MKTVQSNYSTITEKVRGTYTFLVLSDLHGTEVPYMREIAKYISPQAIFYLGDMADSLRGQRIAERLMGSLDYPSYAVTGNHEFTSDRAVDFERKTKFYGIKFLHGDKIDLGNNISLYGVDDQLCPDQEKQWEKISVDKKEFSILLCHRPDQYEIFKKKGFDLVLCGHTHGGQIRLGRSNGLYAPGQGLFPKYAGGEYRLGNTKMIVSRGLVQNGLPRWGNPPEYLVVTIKGY